MWWLVIIVLAFLVPEILSTILDSRLGRAIAAQVESRGQGLESGAVTDRIRHLEGEVDRLSEDVRRLTEETDFFQQLLAERASSEKSRLPRPGDQST